MNPLATHGAGVLSSVQKVWFSRKTEKRRKAQKNKRK